VKECRLCHQSLAFSCFSKNRSRSDGYQKWCKNCVRETAWEKIVNRMVRGAKHRAKKHGYEFDLTPSIVLEINENQKGLCALTGEVLNWGAYPRSEQAQRVCPTNRASLDRIDSSLGYTRSNVQLVTELANRIKGDSSLEELLKVCKAVVFHQRSLQEAKTGQKN